MDRKRKGIRSRGNSIQIDFTYKGKRCRETIKLPPTISNLNHAEKKRNSILYEIEINNFDYTAHFPNSINAKKLGFIKTKTIGEALDIYLSSAHKRCAYSTWRDYKSAINFHLKPTFGELLLTELSTSKIREWIAGLRISNKRINNILVPLRGMLNDAYEDNLIERNPTSPIKNLSISTKEPDPFTFSEIDKIIHASPKQIANLFQFAFWTGLRTSELIALQWQDVDWNTNKVLIQRASVRKREKPPKTNAGKRIIILLKPALEALKQQKDYTLNSSKYVFHNPQKNLPWETDSQIRKNAWIPALKKAKVRYRNPYQTRHTYASMLLTSGENPVWIAQQIGHKDWGMIRKRYGRWIPDIDKNTGSKIHSLLSQYSHNGDIND